MNVYDKKIRVTNGKQTGILFEIDEQKAVVEFNNEYLVSFPVKKISLVEQHTKKHISEDHDRRKEEL